MAGQMVELKVLHLGPLSRHARAQPEMDLVRTRANVTSGLCRWAPRVSWKQESVVKKFL